MNFLAIDFETADQQRDSACAVGLTRVEANKIVEIKSFLIKPPRREFVFTDIHGITWNDVKDSPSFKDLWPELKPFMRGIECFVAHNAGFDKSVLHACCSKGRIPIPEIPFQCTMKLSRQIWDIRPTKLDIVCEHFKIPLNHHDAESDSVACAKIMIKALKKLGK